jgi:uracil-DNA glycosylase
MESAPVSGGAVVSKVMTVGQAPGIKEPVLGKPFAWTAGKTLFHWFASCGVTEETFRSRVYMAAVCRCFPGKAKVGGDRVPSPEEIVLCSHWLEQEIALLKPQLVIPIGRLAIRQFLEFEKLDQVIGRAFSVLRFGVRFDLVPLPHPSGASTWHRMEPGKSLLTEALRIVSAHSAWSAIRGDR